MKFIRHLLLSVFPLVCLGLTGQAQDQPRQQHVGRVLDWSYHHVIVGGGLPAADLDAAKAEPRILFHLAERSLPRVDGVRFAGGRGSSLDRGDRRPILPVLPQKRALKTDWSISLGVGNVAPNMFPAKYSFDINATPSCTGDYVVFGLNVAGSTGQANLVGVTNLYSGSTPRLCGANPSVNWAYNGSTASGAVLTSPVVSLDGKRIAYVESAAGKTVFHVLAWKAGEGTSATAAVAPTVVGSCTTTPNPITSCIPLLPVCGR